MSTRGAVSFPKESLQVAQMLKFRVRGNAIIERIVISMKIDNFSQLKNHVEYHRSVDETEWELIIVKKRKLLKVGIVADESSTTRAGYACYALGTFSSRVPARRITKCLMEVDFPLDIIHDCRNSVLKRGVLWLLFEIERETKLTRIISAVNDTKRNCSSIALNDTYMLLPKSPQYEDEIIAKRLWQRLGASGRLKFWDFVICIPGSGELFAHKAVLAARSKFFCKYIVDNKGRAYIIIHKTTFEACVHVLRFLYSAKLSISRFDVLMEVTELALRLEITSLLHRCSKMMTQRMNDETTCYQAGTKGR